MSSTFKEGLTIPEGKGLIISHPRGYDTAKYLDRIKGAARAKGASVKIFHHWNADFTKAKREVTQNPDRRCVFLTTKDLTTLPPDGRRFSLLRLGQEETR